MLPRVSRCNCGTIAATPEERLRGVSHVPRSPCRFLVDSRRQGVASDLRPITPEHRRKRRACRDQRARRVNNLANPTKSAKPPPPVQIRAAPPNFLRNQRLIERRESFRRTTVPKL